MSRSPRVCTIPASAEFLPTLVRALVEGRLIAGFPGGDDPLALARATLFLPTRRACRLARETFLDVLGGAAIPPRIVPIGDIDEDELVFAEAAGHVAADTLALPPALGGLTRRLLLSRLVYAWASSPGVHGDGHAPLVARTPAAALALADDLARLIDDMTTREVDWARLDDLVPDRFDAYWQLTLQFLKIARVAWPALLAERGAIEPAARRDLLIAAEAERLRAAVDAPVIAAGSTGSMPATARLLAVVARLPHGAVVLPGLDTSLDEPAWQALAGARAEDGRETGPPAAGHPQYAMQALLARIGIARDAVTELAPPAPHGREALVSEILRPAAATDRWRQRLADPAFVAGVERAMAGVAVVEAAHAEDEAMAIAVALREVAETPDRTALLVTPDRSLARRVVAALERWRVAVDDSGGDPLADTAAGAVARLAAAAALDGLAPVTLLALLKHRLVRLGAPEGAHAAAVSALERAVLRGPRPRPGTAGLAHALATFRATRGDLHRADPRRQIDDDALVAADDLVARLAAALAPLERAGRGPHPFAGLARRHHDVVVALAGDDRGVAPLFESEDGAALAAAFEAIAAQPAGDDLAIGASDYADLFATAIGDQVVRRPGTPGARIRVLGPLEARLTTADRVVLGSLTEGTWPPETRNDPWLSRPMRLALGLDLPERRVGLSAHDFAQMLGAREVVLTWAAKLGGAPTVPARFLQRLAAVAGEPQWQAARARGARHVARARGLDPMLPPVPARRPAPRPPVAARPMALSVTEIETWLRDPYSIYARHVLGLTPLDPVDMAPGAADRGTAIHGAIGDFTQAYAGGLPADPLDALIAFGRRRFAPLDDFPEAKAFWWPRFLRIARWFVDWERDRRPGLAETQAEIRGELRIPLGAATFRLSARADRIDRRVDGGYVLIDYKTGAARTEKQVRTGLAPQLTLEAAILRGGGFAAIPAGASVAGLTYVLLKGGDPAGDEKTIAFTEGTPDSQADAALARLAGLAARFLDPQTPYRALAHPMWTTHYGDYDHLARVKEWSATGGAGDDGGGGA